MSRAYGRDLVGYGRTPPVVRWPGGARVAVQFVLNFEEGSENCVLHGDEASETFLSEIVPAPRYVGMRHPSMESLYEYGARAGVWRLLRIFEERDLPLTCFAVAMAMQRNPEPIAAMVEAGHEIASHGWRWIDYQHASEELEREHIEKAIAVHTEITGSRPLGFYQGRTSPHTRRLVVEEGGFVYDADSYADDLPYWDREHGRSQLVVPYSLDVNDMRYSSPAGFSAPDDFFGYAKDTFEMLWAEGATHPRMMSVGLHPRLAGRPGRARALARLLDHMMARGDVWICRRLDIARHWTEHHPAQ